MSEGVSEDWTAVAQAISDRMRELGWNQSELAARSHVSVATVREIQRNTARRRRSPRTLESLSVALGWKPDYLTAILTGQVQPAKTSSVTGIDMAATLSRLDALESRLDEVIKLATEIKANVAAVLEHVRDDH